MNKNELVSQISENCGVSKNDTAKVIDCFFEEVSSTLSDGGEINITGFGKFCVTDRAATEGRNPRTGEKINIAASRVPRFKAGKTLKDAVSGTNSGKDSAKKAPAKKAASR